MHLTGKIDHHAGNRVCLVLHETCTVSSFVWLQQDDKVVCRNTTMFVQLTTL
jgi:hypothetical protein